MFSKKIPRSRTFLATVSTDTKRIEWVDIEPMLQYQFPLFFRELAGNHIHNKNGDNNNTKSSHYYYPPAAAATRQRQQYPPLYTSSSSSSSCGGCAGSSSTLFPYSSSNARGGGRGHPMMMHTKINNSSSTNSASIAAGGAKYGTNSSRSGHCMNHMTSSRTSSGRGDMFGNRGCSGYNDLRSGLMITTRNSSPSMWGPQHRYRQNYHQHQNYDYHHDAATGAGSLNMPNNSSSSPSYDFRGNKNGGYQRPPPAEFYEMEHPPYMMENTMCHQYDGHHSSMRGESVDNRYLDTTRMYDMNMPSQMQQMGGEEHNLYPPRFPDTSSSSMHYPSNLEYGGESGFRHRPHDLSQHPRDMNFVGGDDHFPERGLDRSQMMNNMSAYEPVCAGKMNTGGW